MMLDCNTDRIFDNRIYIIIERAVEVNEII